MTPALVRCVIIWWRVI